MPKDKPIAIIAKTLKGKGVSFIEDKDAWHGKPLSKEDLEKALLELGEVDTNLRGQVAEAKKEESPVLSEIKSTDSSYTLGTSLATRKAYGESIAALAEGNPRIVVLDAETSNSTYAEFVKKTAPERFFEMFIAEQNMVGVAQGFSARGKIPFVSTFAAFFARAFDQIRMAQYSDGNIKFVGSHVGVSIGEDGSSQMGLEDIAIFRTLHDSVVLYPSEGISTHKLVDLAAKHKGNVYIRTTRKEAPVLYGPEEVFEIGGSKTLKSSEKDVVTVIGAGVTLHEALSAYEVLQKEGIYIRVVDMYSVKPIDTEMLKIAANETKAIITVEDHHSEGGIGEAVMSALNAQGLAIPVHVLAVRKMPRSGKPQELLDFEGISANSIVKVVKTIVPQK